MLKRIALLLIVCLLAGMALAEEVVSPEAEAPVADVEFELAGAAEAGETLVAAEEWNEAEQEEIVPKAAAEEFEIIGDEEPELIGYNGNGGDVVFPEGLVMIYATGLFEKNLTSVTFPTTMRTIMDEVFVGQNRLTKVVFQSDVFLGEYAFSDCKKLKTVVLPEGFSKIGYCNFRHCTSLKTLKLPSTLKRIDYAAFSDSGLTDITLNEGLEFINEGAFSNCTGLKEITLPASLENVLSGAFENCANLKTVTVLNPKTDLGNSAFEAWNDDTEEMVPSCAEGFTLRGWPGSTAQAYAKEWGYNFEPLVKVSKVTLNKSGTQSLKLGKTLSLKAAFQPGNANYGIGATAWTSSNEKVATVSDKGVVTPVGKGRAKITATIGGKSKAVTVKVTAPAPTKLELFKKSVKEKNKLAKSQVITLRKGRTLTLATRLTPAYAETSFTWTSSDKKVATVSKGKIKAIAPGTAAITCKTRNGLKFKVKVKVR